MSRRGILAPSWVSNAAIMLAMGLVVIGPAPGTQAAAARAPGTGAPGRTPAAIAPMRLRPPHDDAPLQAMESAPSLTAASTIEVPAPPPSGPTTPAGRAGGRFTFGSCTWWVAQKRPVPWSGNAWQWWGNARALGYPEGSVPRPGAIMVMGISWSSPQGHVAYVESVWADGSFTVSEMNWWGVLGGGWARVDERRVTSPGGVIGFIY